MRPIIRHTTAERYDIRLDKFEWATIVIDERDGLFFLSSDREDFAYMWPHHGRPTFKQFLLEALRPPDFGYFLSKVARTELSPDRSLPRVRDAVCYARRQGTIDREHARAAYELLEGADDLSSQEFDHLLTEVAKLGVPLDSEVFAEDYSYQARKTAELYLPPFLEELRAEMG